MKKTTVLRFLSCLSVTALLLCAMPITFAVAQDEVLPPASIVETIDTPAVSALDQVLNGDATVEEVFGDFSAAVVPDIVGFDTAIENGYVARLFEEEGEDLNKLVFLNDDQTQTMYLFSHPVKYVDGSGQIQDISLDIVSSENSRIAANAASGAAFSSAGGVANAQFAANPENGVSLFGDGVDLLLVPHLPDRNTVVMSGEIGATAEQTAVKPSTPFFTDVTLTDNRTVSYRYDDNTTLEYSLTYTGIKEEIVIHEYTGQTTYSFTLHTNGLSLVEQSGGYVLTDETGAVRATVGNILVFTADNQNNIFEELSAQTVEPNEEYLLTVELDEAYLTDAQTAYPLSLDGTVEISYDECGEGAIQDITRYDDGSTNSGTHLSNFIGYHPSYGAMHTLMKFPGLSVTPNDGTTNFVSATVWMCDVMRDDVPIRVYCDVYAGDGWNESSTDWTEHNVSLRSTPQSYQTVSSSNGAPAHMYAFDITDAVQGWDTGVYNRHAGIIFYAPMVQGGVAITSYKAFGSYNIYNSAYKPYLTARYTVSTAIQNGEYYINNRATGRFLKHNNGLASAQSGTLLSLGETIQWKLRMAAGGYVLSDKNNDRVCLSVSTDLATNDITITTLSDDNIPATCLWNINLSSVSGCLIQSVY
ncbi:MAG: DNRLRE domain-containing protein, partial [Clostridia bacterium]|nr:DNRLRE domain-containing protein [Clostridia bacterium]